jgi:hypothetical protein
MGMSSYVLDLEDKFIDVELAEIIKDSDTLQEAQLRAEDKRVMNYNFIPSNGLNEKVKEMWDEYWSKYNMGDC